MNCSFEIMTSLQYQLKAHEKELQAFRSGEKYVKMQKQFEKEIRKLEQENRKLKQELTKAHRQTVNVRNIWFDTFEQMQLEHKKEVERLNKDILHLNALILKLQRELETERDKKAELRRENYRLGIELEDEKGKNTKLRAQINRDYENSSLPSSKSLRHKKIANSREKTGRRPGAQPGHKGSCRKKQEPTQPIILLPVPQEVKQDPDFKKTSKTIRKQMVSIRMLLEVLEYHADVYRNSKTGECIHAPFPDGVVNDVNYDGSIRAFLFLLNQDCCISIDKSRKFLSDLTGGKLNISKGMVSSLSREFAQKTESEQKKLYADLLLTPVLHTDCTNAKVNGNSHYVYVCAEPSGMALYFSRPKKGHKGIEGSPVQDYQGILVHDHDVTFYRYGNGHQECLAHVLRYLKGSMQNEPERTWNSRMHDLIREIIHYRNGLAPEEETDAEQVSEFEDRYNEILTVAREEYENIPADDYYREGYNLYQRMEKYKENHLLFLHDRRVPATNNEAERLLRRYKRKQQQAMTFRSNENIEYLCQCMSVLNLLRQKDEKNIFDKVSAVYGKTEPVELSLSYSIESV